jgi:DNA-binding NtrC family response regulator
MPVIPFDEQVEVLLVDDELSTRELLEQFCRSRDLPVTTASDGRAAITALERSPSRFTIVMTDINMPGADGFEVLRTARKGNRSCYVVMITGYATLDSALRAVREGAYDYLAKPFSLGQLDVMLARIKDRISLERENRDLRRRLGGRAGAPATPASPSPAAMPTPMYSPAVATAAAPVLHAPRAAAAAVASLPSMPPAPSVAAAPAPAELANRVGTMEDRLGRIEEMLRKAITATR